MQPYKKQSSIGSSMTVSSLRRGVIAISPVHRHAMHMTLPVPEHEPHLSTAHTEWPRATLADQPLALPLYTCKKP